MRQLRNFQKDRCYHLVHRAFYLNEGERTRFVERMRRVAYCLTAKGWRALA